MKGHEMQLVEEVLGGNGGSFSCLFHSSKPPCEAAWSHEEDSTSFAAFASVTWRSRVLEGEQFSNKSSDCLS